MTSQPIEYMIMLDSNMPHSYQVQQQATLQAQQLGDSLRKENEQLKRKLYRANTELSKLHNKINEISNERDSCAQVLEQVQQHLSLNKGDQRTINLVLKNALAVLSQFKSRAVATVTAHNLAIAAANGSQGVSVQQQRAPTQPEKPFPCAWHNCGKRFAKKQHLEAHKNIHIGVRHFCTFAACSKSFVRKYNLNEHMKMHNKSSDNTCRFPGCNKIFSSRFSLTRHQNAQHSMCAVHP